MSNGAITAPRLKPARGMAMVSPLFSVNHLGIVERIGTTEQPIAIPIENPQTRYTCHNALICDISKSPVPSDRPATVTRIRGPYRSLTLPLTWVRTPAISIAVEKAPERGPLSQPNSAVNGFKNRPKPMIASAFVAKTQRLIKTMTQP